MDKVKITQKEVDDMYEIEKTIEDNTIEKEIIKTEEPEFLTEEEEKQDEALAQTLNWDEEE